MKSTSINLLPPERRTLHTRDYYYHLGVIVLAVVSTVTVVAAIQLFPAYIFLAKDVQLKESQLMALGVNASTTEQGVGDRLEALSTKTTVAATTKNAPVVSAMFRALLDVARPGVSVSGINYTQGASPKPSTLLVMGVATTRDALHKYQLALQGAPFATAASLPVSAYAKDSSIPFSITVSLTP
jgi:hypothetical protein